MTLKETVKRELLSAIDDPDELDELFRKYSKSKGPFYLGLADATAELIERFEAVAQDNNDLETEKETLTDQVAQLEDQRIELQQSVQTLVAEVQTTDQRLDEARGSLDRLDQLANAGFGDTEFGRLVELLTQISAGQGGLPEEGVAQFFETVQRYEKTLSLDLEATRAESRAAQAKADAERWVAEASAKEVQSTARIGVIDLVESLAMKGVKGDDLIFWSAIIETAGVTVEQLTGSLEEYSSIQALAENLKGRSEGLQTEVLGLQSQVKSLSQERDEAHQAIIAVKDKALKEVKAAEHRAKRYVDSLVRDATALGDLQKQAAELSHWITAARYLQYGNAENWKSLPPELIQHLLMGLIAWAQQVDRDIPVRAPAAVIQANRLLEFMPLKFSQILFWAMAGVLTDQQEGTQGGRQLYPGV